ncbi:MAG: hypothetical protein AABW41_04245 [Nanoarchaeota archaeon]
MKKASILLILLISLMPLAIAKTIAEPEPTSVKGYIDSLYENVKGKKLNVDKFKVALPVSAQLTITDTDERIFFKLDKTGLLTLPESMRKTDIEIITNKDTFFEIANNQINISLESLRSYIESGKIQIRANSFKAQIAVNILESRLGFKITKEKTFRQRTLAYVASKIASLFQKKEK